MKPSFKFFLTEHIEVWLFYGNEYHYWRHCEKWYRQDEITEDTLSTLNQARAEIFPYQEGNMTSKEFLKMKLKDRPVIDKSYKDVVE